MYRTTPISFLAESACHAPAPVMRIRINYQLLQYKDPDPGYGNSPYGSKSGSGKSLQYTDSRKKKSNNFIMYSDPLDLISFNLCKIDNSNFCSLDFLITKLKVYYKNKINSFIICLFESFTFYFLYFEQV